MSFGRARQIGFPRQHVPLGYRGSKNFPQPHFALGGVMPRMNPLQPMLPPSVQPGPELGTGGPLLQHPTLPPTLEPPRLNPPYGPPTSISPPPFQGFQRPPTTMPPRGMLPRQQFKRGGVAGGGLPAPDFPPADPTTDYNYGNVPGGPIVTIGNPFEGSHAGGRVYGGNNPTPPNSPGERVGATVTPVSPWYTAGPYAGGNQNPNNPGYVGPESHPQNVTGQGGWEGTGASFGFLMGHNQLAGGGVAGPGNPSGGDTVPAMLTPGEVILNRGEQRKVKLSAKEKKSLPPAIVSQMYRARMGR